MKYSFIVPVYNGELYLGECIDSLLSQTVDDFEIIIVDDGSTDGSVYMCDAYAKDNENIRVFHIKNSGVSAARNIGIDNARGENICFVDSDDVVSRGLLSAAENMDADLLIFDYTRETKKELSDSDTALWQRVDNPEKLVDKAIYDDKKYLPFVNCSTVWSMIFKRTLIGDIRFPEAITIGEDKIFNFEVLRRAKEVYVLPEVMYYCRTHNSSVTKRYSRNYYSVVEETFRILEKSITELTDARSRDNFTKLLSLRCVPVLDNVLHLDICSPGNDKSYSERKKQWRTAISDSIVSRYLTNCDSSALCKRDRFIYSLIRYKFCILNLAVRYRLMRAAVYAFYKLTGGERKK